MRNETKLLALLFLILLAVRLYLAFQQPGLVLDAYREVRNLQLVEKKIFPTYDPLSFGGKRVVILPLGYFVYAFFDVFLPKMLLFKLLPNLFFAGLFLLFYWISRDAISDKRIAILASFSCAVMPAIFADVFSFSTLTIAVLVYLVLIKFLMNMRENNLKYIAIIMLLLPFIHVSAILIGIGFLIYLLLVKFERLKQRRIELEVLLFFFVYIIWIYLVLFKGALLMHGIDVFWQNAKHSRYAVDFLKFVRDVGAIPLLCVVFLIYKYFFVSKDKRVYLLTSFFIASFVFYLFRFLAEREILLLVGCFVGLIFIRFIEDFYRYLSKTKFDGVKEKLVAGFLIFVIFMNIFFGFILLNEHKKLVSSEDSIKAMKWLRENTPEDAVIVASLQEGSMVAAIAQRKNIADTNRLFSKDVLMREVDIKRLYLTPFKTDAVRTMSDYNAEYLVFSGFAKKIFGIEHLAFAEPDCFELVRDGETKIYKRTCELKTR